LAKMAGTFKVPAISVIEYNLEVKKSGLKS